MASCSSSSICALTFLISSDTLPNLYTFQTPQTRSPHKPTMCQHKSKQILTLENPLTPIPGFPTANPLTGFSVFARAGLGSAATAKTLPRHRRRGPAAGQTGREVRWRPESIDGAVEVAMATADAMAGRLAKLRWEGDEERLT